MKQNTYQSILLAAVIIAGFIGVFFVGGFLERNRVALPAEYEDEDLQLQGKKFKGFMLGTEGLVADWYWMRSLQYVGNKIINSKEQTIDLGDLTSLNPRLLYPLLDNATDLDPKFIPAYSYGATVLSAINSEHAIALTEKGIANNPTVWRLYHYLGYIHWQLKDYQKAASVYEEGSRIDGAAPFMTQMAVLLRTQGEDRATARKVYEQLLAEAADEQTKTVARRRIWWLDSLDERDGIKKALEIFQQRHGRCAKAWPELIPYLRNIDLPGGRDFQIDRANNIVDPSGAAYILDSEKCVCRLDPKKTVVSLQRE